jgi:hypothetical protein
VISEVGNLSYTSPPSPVAEKLVTSKGTSYESNKTIVLWLKLFSDMPNDQKLTQNLWNTIGIALGVDGNVEGSIAVNLPERNAC